MTRTARAAYPRAVNKDRSASRNGLDPSIRKGGAGHHNWGSLADEYSLEEAAIGDEHMEATGILPATSIDDSHSSTSCKHLFHSRFSTLVYSFILAAASVLPLKQTEEEVEMARNFRKNAWKGGGTSFLLSNHTHHSDLFQILISRLSLVLQMLF
jgi:hypothetical protein